MSNEKDKIVADITCSCRGIDADTGKLEKLAVHICRRFLKGRVTVSIAIVDDEAIRKINSVYLNRPEKTDVISFDLSDEAENCKTFEIIINAEQAMREAAQRGHSAEAELALYLTHGLLHNLGFDDAETAGTRQMHDMEDEILQLAGFGVVYRGHEKTD